MPLSPQNLALSRLNAAAPGFEHGFPAQVEQCASALVRHEDHVAAPTAVASVRPAERNVFFPAERRGTVPAVPGNNENVGFINEFHSLTKNPALAGFFLGPVNTCPK